MTPNDAAVELAAIAAAGSSDYVLLPRGLLIMAATGQAGDEFAQLARRELLSATRRGTGHVASPRALVLQAFPVLAPQSVPTGSDVTEPGHVTPGPAAETSDAAATQKPAAKAPRSKRP